MSREHAFHPSSRRVLQVFCDRIFDPGREDRTSPADIELAEMMSRSMAEAPVTTQLGLGFLIRLINWMPLLLIGRFSRFIRLSREDQDRFLVKLLEHPLRPIRTMGVGLRLTCSLYYWQHPQVLEEIGIGEVELIPEEVAFGEQVAG